MLGALRLSPLVAIAEHSKHENVFHQNKPKITEASIATREADPRQGKGQEPGIRLLWQKRVGVQPWRQHKGKKDVHPDKRALYHVQAGSMQGGEAPYGTHTYGTVQGKAQ